MKRYKELALRLIPLVLAIALMIGLSEVFYRNMIQSETEKCWAELYVARDSVAREISSQLSMNLKALDLASEAIVLNAEESLQDTQKVQEYLAYVQRDTIFERIDVLYPNNDILVQDGGIVNFGGALTYAELAAKDTHISQRVVDFHKPKDENGNTNYVLHAFSPIPLYGEDGNPAAILCATVSCARLAEIFTGANYGDNARLYMIDTRDGHFVLDKWDTELPSLDSMESLEMLAGYEGRDVNAEIKNREEGGVAFISGRTGEACYMAYKMVAGTDFSLAILVQNDVVFFAIDEMKDTLMRVGVLEMAFLLFFVVWIYLVLRRSVKLESRAKEAELALLQEKDNELQRQYQAANERKEFMESLAVNLPGGYHRCTTDHSFRITFMSKSFADVTGYTMKQLEEECGGSYFGVVADEDRELFMSLAPQLEQDGFIHCAYRIRRRDGAIRWVQDSTQYIERDGEAYYQCALSDITEQIEKIEQARREAEANSHAKSTFLFNISHDIRTPMNAIKGFSRIIKENANDPALVMETIEKIDKASGSLMMLMNDVLDISRIERGKEELNLQPIDLYDHGRNLYEMFAGDMRKAGIHFEGTGDGVHDCVYADELKLTRILMNMLSNAMKFTPAGGTVSYGATRLQKTEAACTYRFFVRDTGIGMSEEFKKRAFGQFEREHTSTESGVAGSGLGLAIIKMLVELMDGRVELQSEAGKGTEISAIITFRLADKEQADKRNAAPREVPDVSDKRLLLVEDNAFNREIARYILEGMHFAVEEAENGAVAVEKLTNAEPGHYDLVLMDIQMPVMDGYRAAVEIRSFADRQKAAVPIIAMTANAFEEDKQRCLEVGMNGHIGKPIEIETLKKLLFEVLGKSGDEGDNANATV